MFRKFREIYEKVFTTIRAKLIAIISLIILVSLLLFTGISLNLFQSNMSEMVKLNNGNNAKMLSDKVESELRNQADQMRLLKNPNCAIRPTRCVCSIPCRKKVRR